MASKVLTFIKKWKWWIYNIFAFLCIFDGFLNLWGCFLVESLPNPVAMPELSNWSASKAWQVLTTKTPKFLQNGRLLPPLSPQAPSAIIGVLVDRAIPSDLRSRLEQSHHLPRALLPLWLQAVYRVSNGRPHLQLYRKGAYIHYLCQNFPTGQPAKLGKY